MKYQFTLPVFPNSTFEIETSIWTGRPELFKDGVTISRSDEKGRPFLIPDDSGEVVRAYPKLTFLDTVPTLEINGISYNTVDKLAWYEYAICLTPLILIFIGGAIGGGIGGVATAFNLRIMRPEDAGAANYFKVVGITVLAFALYILVARVILT